jgi:hypothetical protein
MPGVGWRPTDRMPESNEWVMVRTFSGLRFDWFPARFTEERGWEDQNNENITGVKWWRPLFLGEEQPAYPKPRLEISWLS